jgi:four helix bundle protein
MLNVECIFVAPMVLIPAVMTSAKKLEDLVVWQLACELRDAIAVVIARSAGDRNSDYRDQILRSSRSVPANVAEGFSHYKPRQFAKYLRIARASVMETRSHIYAGSPRYFSSAEKDSVLRLTARILAAASSLIRYLESLPPDFELPLDAPKNSARKPLSHRNP